MAHTVKHRKTAKSKTYNSRVGCPSGYHKRSGYTIKKTGTYVAPRCIRSTTTKKQSSKEFKTAALATQKRRLSAKKVSSKQPDCPPGQIARKAYVRKFSARTKLQGYTVKRKSGTVYRVYPKRTSTVVKASCVEDKGLPGKLTSGEGITPLRKGELLKHGYVYRIPKERRHNALRRAVKEYGPLGVYRKLDAVAKLSTRTSPEVSKIFAKDRNWIKRTYAPLKAF